MLSDIKYIDYYYTEQTTANDRFELEAGITFSESAPAGVNYTFRIDTMIMSTRVWNSSVTMTTTDTSLSDVRQIWVFFLKYSKTKMMNNKNKISFNIQTYSQVLQWYDQFL